MAQAIHQHIHRTTARDNGDVETRDIRTYDDQDIQTNTFQDTLEKIVWFVAGVIITLLAFRFLFALLGANPNNAFANFIYSASHPFVAPFFSLFSFNYRYGVSKFEAYTLVAMLVYAVVAWIISELIDVTRRS